VTHYSYLELLGVFCFLFKKGFQDSLETEPDKRIKIVEPIEVESVWENWLKDTKPQFP